MTAGEVEEGASLVASAVGAWSESLCAAGKRVVLAVSGGRDSMVLLDAAARLGAPIAAVATFDHGTGPSARAAASHVARTGRALGLRVYEARTRRSLPPTEASWRRARGAFLAAIGRRHGASVATAHTRDDQIETVLMRVMRGTGARGLAALAATSPIERPLLSVSRPDVAAYASAHGVAWVEDPSNQSLRYFRNRIRHELLPALLAARPSLGNDLLDVATRAAAVRDALERVACALAVPAGAGNLSVATASLADYDAEQLRALWPALAATAGIVLDRRGTEALARFTRESSTGQRLQLSGAVEVVRRRDAIALSSGRARVEPQRRFGGETEWGGWRFRKSDAARTLAKGDAWSAVLPADAPLMLRAWRAGDRMRGEGDAAPRRVKRFLRDAGLVGPERDGWPVVLVGDEIVWIPGVRRSAAAAVRPGRPGDVYICERKSG